MWEITSMGEMSAARITIPLGMEVEERVEGVAGGDLRMALTHSFTPRLRDLALAAVQDPQMLGTIVNVIEYEHETNPFSRP